MPSSQPHRRARPKSRTRRQGRRKTEQEFTDIISAEFARQWKTLGLHVDRFERTTSDRHAHVVQDLFNRCVKNGHVYKGSYTGQYCVYDEAYVNNAKPGDPCPDCGRTTETVTEENYFFRLSAFSKTAARPIRVAARLHPARNAPQ